MIKQEIVRGYSYLKKKGISSTIIKAKRHLKEQASYKRRPAFDVDKLERQRNRVFEYAPLISIIVPLYKTPDDFLRAFIDSVIAQTYGNWELCLADGTACKSSITDIVNEYSNDDSRIKYKILERNDGISGNTNQALDMAAGEFIALADHDDILTPDALYEVVRAINKDRSIDTVYSDEDKTDLKGKSFYMPHFKPDYNEDYFLANNYICHLFVTKSSIARAVNGFDSRFDGAQDYDFICKCIEKSDTVHHIPKVLYHWRCHSNSTAGRPESKMYAYENGIKVLESHYERCGIDADVTMYPDAFGYYKTTYKLKEKGKITVVYVGNNSNSNRRLNYLCDEVFIDSYNVSKINEVIRKQKNRYVLILDNSYEFKGDNAIEQMLSLVMRENTAVAGGRIYDKAYKLVYGGLILGAKGYYGYAFEGTGKSDRGYYLRITVPQDTTGVDGRYMMIDAQYFEKCGGFSEDMPFLMSAIDYCMKVRTKFGKLVVYSADTVAISNCRRKDEVIDRQYIEMFKSKWSEQIAMGDPYYNRNLTLNNTDYSLRKIKK